VTQARTAFDELVTQLAKQHLRLQFRKRFGTEEPPDFSLFKRGTVASPRDKAVTNLLQEVPPKADITRITGTAEALRGTSFSLTELGTVGDLMSEDAPMEVLIVQGRKARLYVFSDRTEDTVYVLRVVTELNVVPKAKVPAKPSRRIRAMRSKGSAEKRRNERGGGR